MSIDAAVLFGRSDDTAADCADRTRDHTSSCSEVWLIEGTKGG